MSAHPGELGRGPEFDRIRAMLAECGAATARDDVRVGPGDDAAVLEDGTVLSVDMSVEDVHFRRDWLALPEIGYRAAAAALSDLAAMAAQPVGLLVSFALPAADADAGVELMRGVADAAARAGAAVLGGDLTASPAGIIIDVAVVGRVVSPVRRSGARAGDALWVTGRLGAAASAVHAWQAGREPASAARAAFAQPTPRLREALWLAGRGVLHALIDVSDGVAGDAGHIAAASGVAVIIDAASVPIAPAVLESAPDEATALRLALGGGEDYELLFTAEDGAVEPVVEEFARSFETELTRIGAVEHGSGVQLRTRDGRTSPLEFAGFQHFEGA